MVGEPPLKVAVRGASGNGVVGAAGALRFYLRAVSYFRPDLPLVGLLFAMMAVSTALGLLQAWPVAILIDSVVMPVPRSDWIHRLLLAPLPDDRLGQILGLAVVAVVLRLAAELLSVAQTLLGYRLNYNGLLRLRCALYRKLQELHLDYHQSQPQGDLIYRLSGDTFAPQGILGVGITVVFSVVTLVVMLGIMVSRSAQLTLLALSLVPFLVLANAWFTRTLRERVTAAKQADASVTTTIQRSLTSIGLVQAFRREAEEFGLFRRAVGDCIRAWFRLHRQEVSCGLAVSTLLGIWSAAILAYGGYLVYRDQFLNPVANGMSIGDLTVFLAYLGGLYEPLRRITGAGTSIQGGAGGTRRVFEVLDQEAAIADAPDAISLPVGPRTLTLEHVSFEYGPGRRVLHGVDASISPGQLVAIIGPSGAGKSTLLNLLPRFYDPTRGAVRLDGHDLRRVKVSDVRAHVALVPQDGVILPASVAENIAYGRPDASGAEIRRAAELAGASAFIEQLPRGYDTEISEGGLNLSAGQRQRIAIARALLTEAPIVVLDEPTSALDPHHERLIMETLRSLQGQRTIVLVTHRLGTVTDCDQILVLDGGGVVERGTHGQLLAQRGRYAAWAAQQLRLDAPGQPKRSDAVATCGLGAGPGKNAPACSFRGTGLPPGAVGRLLTELQRTGHLRIADGH